MTKKGWKGEPRRHGLARKGVKTIIDDDNRLAVNNFVAKGDIPEGYIDITGIDKAELLAALYNNAKTQGFIMEYVPFDMTIITEAYRLLSETTKFDYLKGRVMKVDLAGDSFDPYFYDRDNGQGAALRIVNSIKRKHGMV